MKAAVTFIIALLYLIVAVSVGYLVAQTASSEERGSIEYEEEDTQP